MDLFQYQATIANIDSLKYVKDLEAVIRDLVTKLPGRYNTSSAINHDYNGTKLTYKAFIYALNQFTSKSSKILPEFVYNTRKHMTEEVISYFEYGEPINAKFTYDELLDVFEYTNVAYRRNYNSNKLEQWHSIVLDNPIPFTMQYDSFLLSAFDVHSVENLNSNVSQLVRAIRLKQTLSPDSPSTILDENLAYWTELAVASDITMKRLTNAIPLAKQQITAIEEAITVLSNK